MSIERNKRESAVADEINIKEHKIMSMEENKREKVIHAAMAEFIKGYRHASTDVIVRESGILNSP